MDMYSNVFLAMLVIMTAGFESVTSSKNAALDPPFGSSYDTSKEVLETENKPTNEDEAATYFLVRYLLNSNRQPLLRRLIRYIESADRRSQMYGYMGRSLENTLGDRNDKRTDNYWQSMGGPLPVEPSLSKSSFSVNPSLSRYMSKFNAPGNPKMMRFGRSSR